MKRSTIVPFAFLAALVLGFAASNEARANPIPMPHANAVQTEGAQDVRIFVQMAESCPSGTIYRGKRIIKENWMWMLDLTDKDTVAVATVQCADASSSPDPYSDGVTHYSVGASDTCVPPGEYHYQLFSGNSPITWIESYSDEPPQGMVVSEVDTSCLPSPESQGCSIAMEASEGSGGFFLLALAALSFLLVVTRKK
jgi:hypothetical protein